MCLTLVLTMAGPGCSSSDTDNKGTTCSGGTTQCGDKCVDTAIDPKNCGTCSNSCSGGKVCSAGKCSFSCSGGTTQCGSTCVDINTDSDNCGDCGQVCPPGELCSAGVCGVTCLGGTTECDSKCVDTKFDPANCGTCGKACATGQVCSLGECGLSCQGGTSACNGKCVDTNFDPANCGTCGKACATGEVCSAGLCNVTCMGGTTKCGTMCIDTQNDPDNCGTCDKVCPTGEMCSAGKCAVTCLGGTTKCGTTCVDTQNDPLNCGVCSKKCGTGEVCSAGKCDANCLGGTTKCGTKCVDAQWDPANCGSCLNACTAEQVCSLGKCDVTCQGGTTKCNGQCVDTDFDPVNCGTCDKVCPTGEVCSGGLCSGMCDPSMTQCGFACVDVQTNPKHCGDCDKPCDAGSSCIAGKCVACDSLTTDCDGDGWLVSEGDCCDKPGLCGSEPAKVNPGAIEVVGNGIDDNCNNKPDLFDQEDTVSCDSTLASDTTAATDFAKAIGICRTTTESPATPQERTWGLISAQLLRADGSALADHRAHSIRTGFGRATISSPLAPLEGGRIIVLSTGIAADATQTNPGPNGGAPAGSNVSNEHSPTSSVNIQSCTDTYCIKDWYSAENLPLKEANGLPNTPGCSGQDDNVAQDSVMLVLRLRAPTNAKAFSFSSYFFSAEYPEYVCSDFNDQLIALVDTPSGTPSPITNPKDKNLMTYIDTVADKQWPIGINIAKGTSLFSVCEDKTVSSCWDNDVSDASCLLGAEQLAGTGFETPSGETNCTIGGGSYWLTTAGNVIPGEIVELRIVLWDVSDNIFDSLVLIDGFKWLPSATLPGTGG